MRAPTGFVGLMTLVYATAVCPASPAPQAKPDLERGKQLASTVCVACHGADGNSSIPANPILAGQGADYIAAQLAAYKSGKRQNPIMAGMAGSLQPDDMRNVGAWFESQKPAPTVARDKDLAMRGQPIWRGGIRTMGVPACAGCHGASGKGIPAQYPRLAGQHPELTYGWLKAYASGARTHAVMNDVAARLSDSEMRALSEYVAGLR